MTQDRDPLHNALVERMNNTLMNGWLCNGGYFSFSQANEAIDQAVRMYNTARPHQSLNMRTPMQVVTGKNDNPLFSEN